MSPSNADDEAWSVEADLLKRARSYDQSADRADADAVEHERDARLARETAADLRSRAPQMRETVDLIRSGRS